MFLLHGIRTQGEWASRAAAVIERDPSIRVRPIRYEFFDIIRFLIPISRFRDQPVKRVTRLLRDELSKKPEYISIVAHSFGSFVVGKILDREPDIRFHRLILCGSILDDGFDWGRFGHRLDADSEGDWHGLNDCGMKDIWPVFAKSVTWGYGSSGRFGFGHPRIKDRFFDVGHSGFFGPDHVAKYWLPYLRFGRIQPGVLDRPTNSWWVSVLTVVKLRYLLIGLLVALTVFSLKHQGLLNLVPLPAATDTKTALTKPLVVDSLNEKEKEAVQKVRADEHVEVSLESFFAVAVLSGQITESELDAFLNLSSEVLSGPESFYGDGDQDAISIGADWEVFIWRTKNPSVFEKVQAGVLEVIQYLLDLRSGKLVEKPNSLLGVTVNIRGQGRFFDLEGVPGAGQRTWVGFDLRN